MNSPTLCTFAIWCLSRHLLKTFGFIVVLCQPTLFWNVIKLVLNTVFGYIRHLSRLAGQSTLFTIVNIFWHCMTILSLTSKCCKQCSSEYLLYSLTKKARTFRNSCIQNIHQNVSQRRQKIILNISSWYLFFPSCLFYWNY